MATYHVGIREVHINTVEVEADTPEEAKKKARESQADSILLEYSHTLDPDTWSVSKVLNPVVVTKEK